MAEFNQTSEVAPIDQPPRRSRRRLVLIVLAELVLIAIFFVIVFVMWLPAIVSKG